jgi:hypothetical protein
MLITAAVAMAHAAEAPRFEASESIDVSQRGMIHIVGAGEGDSRCTVSYPGDVEVVEVGTRAHRLDSIPSGQRLAVGSASRAVVTCDRAVAVATGPAVAAYPLASSPRLAPVYAGTAVLGLLWHFLRRRTRAAEPPVPVANAPRPDPSPPNPQPPDPQPPEPQPPEPLPPEEPVAEVSRDQAGEGRPLGSHPDVLSELAYGDPRAALIRARARMARDAAEGLRAVVKILAIVAVITVAVTALVAWPVALLVVAAGVTYLVVRLRSRSR